MPFTHVESMHAGQMFAWSNAVIITRMMAGLGRMKCHHILDQRNSCSETSAAIQKDKNARIKMPN